MRADVLQVKQAHIGYACDRITNGRHRRDATARENIALYEIDGLLRGLVALVGNSDRLQQHRSFGLE